MALAKAARTPSVALQRVTAIRMTTKKATCDEGIDFGEGSLAGEQEAGRTRYVELICIRVSDESDRAESNITTSGLDAGLGIGLALVSRFSPVLPFRPRSGDRHHVQSESARSTIFGPEETEPDRPHPRTLDRARSPLPRLPRPQEVLLVVQCRRTRSRSRKGRGGARPRNRDGHAHGGRTRHYYSHQLCIDCCKLIHWHCQLADPHQRRRRRRREEQRSADAARRQSKVRRVCSSRT